MKTIGKIDPDLANWNDRMYALHPTPYESGIAAYIQKRRVHHVLKLANLQSGEKVLELGCESGKLLAACPNDVEISGADISTKALADADDLFRSKGRTATLIQVDAMQPLPFERGSFNVIICSEMLEHVSNPTLVISQIAYICTPETRVILTVPIEAPKVFIKNVLFKLGLIRLFFPNIEAGQSEWHLQSFSKSMLRGILDKQFEILKIKNIWGCHLVASIKLTGEQS